MLCNEQQKIALARMCWDALVVRSIAVKPYTYAQLATVSDESITKEASVLASAAEIMRAEGSKASLLPRDRFNPFTHSPSQTVRSCSRHFPPFFFSRVLQVRHQSLTQGLQRYKMPYCLVVLTYRLLELNGLETEGIFRINAEASALDNMKRYLVTENWKEIRNCDNVHAVAGSMKNYFSSLSGASLFPDPSVVVSDLILLVKFNSIFNC